MCANSIGIRGIALDAPVFSHISHGISFYKFTLESVRLSGVSDYLPVYIADTLQKPAAGQTVSVKGQVRSYNNHSGQGARLVIFIQAQSIVCHAPDTDEPSNGPENHAELSGMLCKEPTLRRTPFGREICDLTLAVPRGNASSKSDYLPCIAWGHAARQAARLTQGDSLSLEGRLQSRKYRKLYEDGHEEEKTAYEVSVAKIIP